MERTWHYKTLKNKPENVYSWEIAWTSRREDTMSENAEEGPRIDSQVDWWRFSIQSQSIKTRKLDVFLFPKPKFQQKPTRDLKTQSIHGILQARILEWVAMPFSRGSSQPRHQICVSCIVGRFFTIWVTREAPGKPLMKCQGLVKYGDWLPSVGNQNLNTCFVQGIHERRHSLN